MYEITTEWMEYYRALDPVRRKRMLNELLNEENDDGANAFRKKLFNKRHVNPKKPQETYDLFLWVLVTLSGLYRKKKLIFVNIMSELERVKQDLFLNDQDSLNQAEKDALYWELRNTADRYFSVCKNDNYGSSMMGLKKADAKQKRELAAFEAWAMGEGLYLHTGLEELKIVADAIRDSYYDYDPNGRELFGECDKKNREEAISSGSRLREKNRAKTLKM